MEGDMLPHAGRVSQPLSASLGTCMPTAHTDRMYRFLYSLLTMALFWAPAVEADQRDKRLDTLFERLHTTENANEAKQITRQIWIVWRDIENEDVDTLMDEGIRDMMFERYDQALTTFSKVVKITPGYAEGWNKRATLLYLMGDYAGSVADIKRTLVLEPRHFGAWSGLGLIYLDLDNDEAALQAFEKALEVNPHLPGSRRNIENIKKRQQEKII